MDLTHERFEALAQAYGGDVARWPPAERDAAATLMAAEPAFTQRLLADAGRMDEALDAFRFTPASGGLAEAILAHAPQRRRRPAWLSWLTPVGLGAGLAAACAAGLIVGVQVSNLPSASAETLAASAGEDAEFSLYAEEEAA
ncbi:hypothetical protein [Phenylobacterium sp.]|uniref:hypothetical protein n=1 Tax=Phenylobacterium sp. TaxID=1871053 RepID=UPI003982ED85